jgi:hypothetical protein
VVDDLLWLDLVGSVRRRRSFAARFFKPVCLIAMLDLVGEGEIDPSQIDAKKVMDRFRQYVGARHPERAHLGWEPLWHLSNDGAWIFTKRGRRILPRDFGDARKPKSQRQLTSRFDNITVPRDMLELWRSAEARNDLRNMVISMLAADNSDCRALAEALSTDSSRGPTTSRRLGDGQGFQPDALVRRAVERRAMNVTLEWLRANGWAVTDQSATESYDLLAERGKETLYMEVKGTTGGGEAVELTRLEVVFARANRESMALAVVARIAVVEVGDEIEASGGELTVRRPWAPSPGSLQPISFVCHLDAQYDS